MAPVTIEFTSYNCSYTVEGLHMDMIYKETFHAAKVAYVVNMVSSSYVQVSKEHIMSRIAGKTCKLHQTFEAAKILLFQNQNRAGSTKGTKTLNENVKQNV